MAKLDELNIPVEEFNDYGRFMELQNVVEPDSLVDKYPTVRAFTQSDKHPDSEILKIFEARDELQASLDAIGEVPTDAEWFQAGRTAEDRITELKPFYEELKSYEWEQLKPIVPLMMMGAPTELVAGATDLRYDFKEQLHERGFGTSWNPLTGFGAWDIAEFNINPETGQRGFSPDLLAMEEELEQLYGQKRVWNEKIEEGDYLEGLPGSDTRIELDRLNQMINEEQLLDPRMYGEAQ